MRLFDYLSIFSFLSGYLATSTESSSESPTDPNQEYRKEFEFDFRTKWDCFYRSTLPVDGLDPKIWRQDEYGNLVMASINFGVSGCLSYSFDHRFPISEISTHPRASSVSELVKSIDNCQALSYRTNILKGSSLDGEVTVIDRFGCDAKTMSLFTKNEFAGAKVVQNHLISDQKYKQIESFYDTYINGPNYLDPTTSDPKYYFETLRMKGQQLEMKIVDALHGKVSKSESPQNKKQMISFPQHS